MEYVLALGTNIGNRKENLQRATSAISMLIDTEIVKISSIYQTEPVGYDDQQDFYNIVMHIKSKFEPNEILGICMGIEAAFGRVREIKNGPRILDIDLIFAEGQYINTKNLIVPHPRFSERRFVLAPLLEIFEDGKFFDIDFNGYIEKIEGQQIQIVDTIVIRKN